MAFCCKAFALDENKCFKNNFNVEVIHKGQPFGLLPVSLRVDKKDCTLSIYHEKLKFQKVQWEIDVCREPVHIKKGAGAVEVIKNQGICAKNNKNAFCDETDRIFEVFQDDGLIFAEGAKEDFATDHGKLYCSYMLLKNYLSSLTVFNRGEDYSGRILSQTAGLVIKQLPDRIEVPQEAPRPEMVNSDSSQVESEESIEEEKPVVEEEKTPSGKGFF